MSHTKFIDFIKEYINKPEDFSELKDYERHSFIRRLNGFAERERERVSPELIEDIRLKAHYHISKHPQHGWQNIPNETFSRKLAFFSGKTIITFPFNEVRSDNDGIQALLKTLCAAMPFMEEDMVNIFSSTHNGKTVNQKKFDKEYGLISANFKKEILAKQFNEELSISANIYLPVFKNITANDVIEIRKENYDLYRALEIRIANLLSGKIDTEEELLKTLKEIDQHIAKLNEKFKNIEKAIKSKNIFCLLSMVKIIVAIPNLTSSVIAAAEAIIEGSVVVNALNQAKTDVKEDDYYLFWRINNPKINKL